MLMKKIRPIMMRTMRRARRDFGDDVTYQSNTMIEGKWYPVVRYDTVHGFAHRDLIDIKGKITKTPLFIQDYNDALTFAESDLKANWGVYRERFLRG